MQPPSLQALLLLGLPGTLAHMHLSKPTPLHGGENKFRDKSKPYDLAREDDPLKKDGSNYPCKGYKNLIGTKEGSAVDTWKAGSVQIFKLGGSAPHFGGSCQASLSYDQAKTFQVVKSFPGSCPMRGEGSQEFNFTVPDIAPSQKEVVFSWTWHNREQEMYSNCAIVEITSDTKGDAEAFKKLPATFVADIGGDCETIPGHKTELLYPDLGKEVQWEVTKTGKPTYPLVLPKCKSGPVVAVTYPKDAPKDAPKEAPKDAPTKTTTTTTNKDPQSPTPSPTPSPGVSSSNKPPPPAAAETPPPPPPAAAPGGSTPPPTPPCDHKGAEPPPTITPPANETPATGEEKKKKPRRRRKSRSSSLVVQSTSTATTSSTTPNNTPVADPGGGAPKKEEPPKGPKLRRRAGWLGFLY